MTRGQVEAALRTAHINAVAHLIETSGFPVWIKTEAMARAMAMCTDAGVSPLNFAPATSVAYQAFLKAEADPARLALAAQAWGTDFNSASRWEVLQLL